MLPMELITPAEGCDGHTLVELLCVGMHFCTLDSEFLAATTVHLESLATSILIWGFRLKDRPGIKVLEGKTFKDWITDDCAKHFDAIKANRMLCRTNRGSLRSDLHECKLHLAKSWSVLNSTTKASATATTVDDEDEEEDEPYEYND